MFVFDWVNTRAKRVCIYLDWCEEVAHRLFCHMRDLRMVSNLRIAREGFLGR